jgi:hypothetical protein
MQGVISSGCRTAMSNTPYCTTELLIRGHGSSAAMRAYSRSDSRRHWDPMRLHAVCLTRRGERLSDPGQCLPFGPHSLEFLVPGRGMKVGRVDPSCVAGQGVRGVDRVPALSAPLRCEAGSRTERVFRDDSRLRDPWPASQQRTCMRDQMALESAGSRRAGDRVRRPTSRRAKWRRASDTADATSAATLA